MKIERIIFVLALFFLVGVVVGIPYGFLTKWEPESAYAKSHPRDSHPGYSHLRDSHPWDNDQGDNDQGDNDQGDSHQSVPEPSTVILLGAGLAAFGGYGFFRFKNKGK
jgi:hypothetical protein